MEAGEKKPEGASIGLVVIILILIIGGIYIWQSKVKQLKQLEEQKARDAATATQNI